MGTEERRIRVETARRRRVRTVGRAAQAELISQEEETDARSGSLVNFDSEQRAKALLLVHRAGRRSAATSPKGRTIATGFVEGKSPRAAQGHSDTRLLLQM